MRKLLIILAIILFFSTNGFGAIAGPASDMDSVHKEAVKYLKIENHHLERILDDLDNTYNVRLNFDLMDLANLKVRNQRSYKLLITRFKIISQDEALLNEQAREVENAINVALTMGLQTLIPSNDIAQHYADNFLGQGAINIAEIKLQKRLDIQPLIPDLEKDNEKLANNLMILYMRNANKEQLTAVRKWTKAFFEYIVFTVPAFPN